MKKLIIVALALAAGSAGAQTWPNKPITWVNPFPAGGGTDAFARPLAARLSGTLGQQVIVENMGGAGGTVGAASAAKRSNDGYTWFVGAVHHSIAESLYPKLPYNIERDFEPITVIASVPNVVVLHPKHPFRTMQEFTDFMRRNPGRLNFGSAGSGTSHHLAVELFKAMTKTFSVHIPYRGAGPLMVDLLAGNVDFAFDGMGTSAPQIRAGKLRALAVTSAQRNPAFPDLPTVAETGVPGYEVRTWYGVWAIRGTPREAQQRMWTELDNAVQHPDVRKIWAEQGADAPRFRPEEFARYLRAEIEKWARVVKESGAKVDN